ncbi:hypothetical protein Tco_1466118, partial [Tanacetum coccineum]
VSGARLFKQRLADQEEACKKKRKRRESPRTPPGSPPTQPPPPPPPSGISSAPGTSGASGSSQLPPSPPPPSTGTFGYAQQQGSQALNSKNDHQLKADLRKDWWKPLLEEERLATHKPAWTIPSSNKSDVVNNWASALATTYEPPAENSLLAKIRDMTTFMNWYYQKFHMEECHKMLTAQVGRFQKEIKKGSNPALSISKMKAASYPDFGLELLVPEQMWIDDVCTSWHKKDVRTHMRILSVVRIKAYSRYGYDYLSKIVLRRANFQEYTIAEKDFKNMYRIDFEDLNLLLLQGHLDHLHSPFYRSVEPHQPGFWDATGYEFKLDYSIIEFLESSVPVDNKGPNDHADSGTQRTVTMEQRVHNCYERRLKTRRIYRNLECFVGGRARDIDCILLQRTE